MKDLPNVEEMRCDHVEPCQPEGLAVGSITFAPNKNAPCYDPAVVLAQAEVDLESSVKAGMQIDTSTILWWMQQSDEARGQVVQDV